MCGDESEQFDDGAVSHQEGQIRLPLDIEETECLDFQMESNPAITESKCLLNYPTARIQVDKEGRYTSIPEMDFRKLSAITDTTSLTHAIHKHPAVFIPQIPNYIINKFTSEFNSDGERPLVLDPYSGSGTSGVEAKISGRDYLGIEINPLSKLVSEVATTPIPPSLLTEVEHRLAKLLADISDKIYTEYDVVFPGQTSKEHWFTNRAIRKLTQIKKAVNDYNSNPVSPEAVLSNSELQVIKESGVNDDQLHKKINRWLVLMIGNTVFDISNADPSVSKAHKSRKMRDMIEEGEHPPEDICRLYIDHLRESREDLTELWQSIYGPSDDDGIAQSDLRENQAHLAEVDIRLGDAREFDVLDEKRRADLALTSPPYINAMNYYRGTKLRLFWMADLLEDNFDSTRLRRSIVGTNSTGVDEVGFELPGQIKNVWRSSVSEFENTNLPDLDKDIRAIHEGSLSESTNRALVTWRFFAEDMLKSISRTFEHLKPGAYFFLIIGENTIGGRRIKSHKYVADIARNLGKFDLKSSGGEFDKTDGFNVVGAAIDEISNRELFQERNHRSGVIEHEWVVILQKPIS